MYVLFSIAHVPTAVTCYSLQIIVNSMHRYQPRLHIVESDDINSFNWETRQTFIFPETQFTTVTAYQNDKV